MRQAMDSVLSQEGVDVELIVIDDGSTDSSPEILKEYAGRIKVFRQPNSKQAVAQNRGLRAATGEYIAYLDSDDICLPGRLRLQVEYLQANPDVDIVYTATQYIDAAGEIFYTKIPKAPNPIRLLYLNDVPHSAVMHRRKSVSQVGYFDESYPNQDWDYWVRFSEYTRLGLLTTPLVKYRAHPLNLTHTRKNKWNYYRRNRMMLLYKTLERRKFPFWLLLCYLRAWLEWKFLSNPILSNLCPKVWWRIHYLWNLVEGKLVYALSWGSAYPKCWRE